MESEKFDAEKEMARLLELIKLCRSKGVTYRYSDEVKNQVLKLKANDVSIPLICARSGINMKSIYNWSKGNTFKKKKFKSLEVSSCGGLEISFPNGVRVKGLSLSEIQKLVSNGLSD